MIQEHSGWCSVVRQLAQFGRCAIGIPQQSPADTLLSSGAILVNIYMNDFGELAGTGRECALAVSAWRKTRRVFGDSITDIWPLAEYFPGKPT